MTNAEDVTRLCALVAFRDFSRVSTLDRVHACGINTYFLCHSCTDSFNKCTHSHTSPNSTNIFNPRIRSAANSEPVAGQRNGVRAFAEPCSTRCTKTTDSTHTRECVRIFLDESIVCACVCALCTFAICSIVKQFVQQIVSEKKRNPSTQVRNRPPGVTPPPPKKKKIVSVTQVVSICE